MRDFWGITVLRLSFEKFLRNSSEIFPTKFLWNTSPEIPEKFLGLGHYIYGFLGELLRELVLRNSWEFLQNFTPRKS